MIRSLFIAFGFALSFATSWSAGVKYPGVEPGPAYVSIANDTVAFSNNVIGAAWTLFENGISQHSFRDVPGQRSLMLTGEVFQIVLTNGTRYTAARLVPDGKPRLLSLTPKPKAARLAARVTGKSVEVPLRSVDGRLRVVWRALALDGANYVRQEIEATALKEDLPLREIVWLDQPIPGAATAGDVDGSPMVAGPFFFGCEDPMASNQMVSPEREVGSWFPADLAVGQHQRKTWPLDTTLLRCGTNTFVFRYERGPHRLDIWRVALLADGREIAHDDHHGYTGVLRSFDTYQLGVPRLEQSAKYELLAELSTDPDFKLPPGRAVESLGKVLLRIGEGAAVCRLQRNTPLRPGEALTQSFVIGVAPAGQQRRAFLYYLERERAHPYRPFLHYNSWYDIAWSPFALNETNCLEAVRLFGERFIQPHGVVMDAMVFDDGWDDPKTLWQFHHGFPKGFAPLADLCRQYHTHLGVWLSPFGGYGEARNQRLRFGREQGYEANATGFSLAGPKYYAAFKRSCVDMIRTYGVNHFKFDGIAAGTYASGGAGYVRDTEAMRRLMLELRQEDPALYINLTTGSWPSPFWLRYADSVWRQGNDMGFAGKGNKQQQWLTYRDQEVRENIVGKGPLFPLNSLMTQGVAWSRHGMAADPEFDSAGFKDDVRMFFGGGTSLQELYIQPQRLSPRDWQVLAEAAKWSRANADVLADTHWIGGDAAKLEVYGYASWSPRAGIVALRNPDDQPHHYELDVRTAFELPLGAPARFTLQSPWAEDSERAALHAEAGTALRLALKPFEIVILNATPLN